MHGHTQFRRLPEQCKRGIDISNEQKIEPAGKHVIETHTTDRTDDPGLRTWLSGARRKRSVGAPADEAVADRRKQVLADLDSLSGVHRRKQFGIACARLFRIQLTDDPTEPLRDFDHFPHQRPTLCLVGIEQAFRSTPKHASQLP